MKKFTSFLLILLLLTGIFSSISAYAQTETNNTDNSPPAVSADENSISYEDLQEQTEEVTETDSDSTPADSSQINSDEEDEEIFDAADIEEPEELKLSGVSKVTMNELSVGDNKITVSWKKVSGAAKYRLQYQISTWSYWKTLTNTTSTSYTLKSLTNMTTYNFRVYPINSSGTILNSSCDVKSVTYRSTPTNLKASATTSQGCIKVTWDKVSGCDSYQVFYKKNSSGWIKCGVVSSNSFTHKNCQNNVKYTYTVRCLENGKYVSGHKSGVSIQYYRIPGNLKASIYNYSGKIKVTWSAISGAAKYKVYYKIQGASGWKTCGYSTSTSYVHSGCKLGTTYVYTVRACNSSGANISSYFPSGAVIHYDYSCETPSNIKAQIYDYNGRIKITWDAVSGASKYRVFYKYPNASGWTRCSDFATTNSYIHTGCSNGKTYIYTVRACDSSGNYISSYDKTGVTIKYSNTLAAPSNIKAVRYDNSGRIKITWNAVSGAPKYRVFYKYPNASGWTRCDGFATTNSYIHTGCSNGKTYIYTVRVCDSSGNYISSYDKTGAKITYYKSLATPSNIKAVKYDDSGRIRITWNAVSGAPMYRVFYKYPNASGWTRCSGFATTNSYIHTGCSNGVTYIYTVRVCDTDGSYISSYDKTGASITYTVNDWRTLYSDCIDSSEYLNYIPSEFKSNSHYFELHDMDNNGIPELILYIGNEPGTRARYLFLTVRNGKVVNLGNYTLGRNLFYDSSNKKKGLFSCAGSSGHNIIVNISLDGNTMTIKHVCQYDVKDENDWSKGFNITTYNSALYNIYVGCSSANSIYPSYVRTPDNQLRAYTLGTLEDYGTSFFYSQYGY